MKLFWKGIATVFFYAVSAGLLVYAAVRSLHFIQATLPPDQALIGYLGLLATSGGMIVWLLVFLHKAEGMGQKITAGLMTVIDLLGEFALFTFDTLYVSGEAGMTAAMSADEIRMVVLGLSLLIAMNIGATVVFHLVEPENMKNMRESFVRDRLEDQSLKLIEKKGEEIARDLAPKIAEQWATDFENRFADMQSLGFGKVNGAKKPQAEQKAPPLLSWLPLPGVSKNGHKNGHKNPTETYNLESPAPGSVGSADESEDRWLETIKGYYRILRNDEDGNATVIRDFTPTNLREFRELRAKAEGLKPGDYFVFSSNNMAVEEEGEAGKLAGPFRRG